MHLLLQMSRTWLIRRPVLGKLNYVHKVIDWMIIGLKITLTSPWLKQCSISNVDCCHFVPQFYMSNTDKKRIILLLLKFAFYISQL